MRKSKAESALDAMANQKAKKENSTTIDEEALCPANQYTQRC
jgi:hypothetical protein